MTTSSSSSSSINDYHSLILSIPPIPAYPREVNHYLYCRPHAPKLPTPDTPRSLFISNIPIDSTPTHFRTLFLDPKLSNTRIERIDFQESRAPANKNLPTTAPSKKRKRVTQEDLISDLPQTWDREVFRSGSSAVVVFADKPTLDAAFKAIRKLAHKGTSVPWPVVSDAEKAPTLGSARYEAHHRLRYPDRSTLQTSVDAYMTAFGEMEQARTRNAARLRAEPDEDGFVTVTRGPKAVPKVDSDVASEAQLRAERKRQKEEEKKEGLGDFYRFQVRERKKAEAGNLVKRFEMDRRKVRGMRQERG